MGVTASAVRAGLAVVELGGDMGPLEATLNRARAKMTGYAGFVAKLGAGVGGLGAGVGGPHTKRFKDAVSDAASMGTLGLQLGLTAEKASALAYAMGTVGIGQEDLVRFAGHLNSKFVEMYNNAGNARAEFAAFGVDLEALSNIPLDEQLKVMTEAISKFDKQADKTQKLKDLFGRGGLELGKLKAGDIDRLMGEAGDVGAVTTQQQAEQAKEVSRSFAQMSASIKYAFLEVGRAILPASGEIKEFAGEVVKVARDVRTFITENKTLVLTALAVGAGLMAAGVAFVTLGALGAAAAGVLTGAVLAAKAAVIGLLAVVAAPFALAPMALAAGAMYLFATQTEVGRRSFASFKGDLVAGWGTIKDTAVEAWGGIASALRRGDLESAAEIALAGLTVIWRQMRITFASVWRTIITETREALDDVAVWVGQTFLTVAGAVGVALSTTVDALRGALAWVIEGFGSAVQGVSDLISGLIRAFGGLLEGVRAVLGQVVQMIADAVKGITDTLAGLLRKVGGTKAAALAGLQGTMLGLAGALSGGGAAAQAAADAVKGRPGDIAGRLGGAADAVAREGKNAKRQASEQAGDVRGDQGAGAARVRAGVEDNKRALEEWARDRQAQRERDNAADRAGWGNWLQEGRDALADLLESEEWKAYDKALHEEIQAGLAEAGRAHNGPPVQQAAREARGLAMGLTVNSGSAQQALAVGSSPYQRQLVEQGAQQVALLGEIRDRVDVPVLG